MPRQKLLLLPLLALLQAPGTRGGNRTAAPWTHLYEGGGNPCFDTLKQWGDEQVHFSATEHCLQAHTDRRRILKASTHHCAATTNYERMCAEQGGQMCQYNGQHLGASRYDYRVDLCVPSNCTDEQLLLTESGQLSESISCPNERRDALVVSALIAVMLALQAVCALFAAKVVAERQSGWRTPILGCHRDIGVCCFVWLCPCQQWGEVVVWAGPDAFDGTPRETGKYAIDNRKAYRQLHSAAQQVSALSQRAGCWCCGGWRLATSLAVIYIGMQVVVGLATSCSFAAVVMLGAVGREALRRRVAIEGRVVEDLALHCCLHQCALCQEASEIQASATQWGGGSRRQEARAHATPVIPLAPVVAIGTTTAVESPMTAAETHQNPVVEGDVAGYVADDDGLEQQFL
eukprot:COSAG05_NODE_672_length_7990_cov_9.794830_4_plen_403_part_00